jgi:DNA primase large subunit
MAVRGAAPVDERTLLAEYPFLPGAEALVVDSPPSIGELLRHPGYARAREYGRARIRAAVDDPTGASRVAELPHLDPQERYLSFQYARFVLSAARTRAPIRRWAVAEAKEATGRLAGEELEGVLEVSRRLGFPLELDGGAVAFRLPDYLRLATAVREAEFRLVHQAVHGGLVRVSKARAVRLLQEGIRKNLGEPVELAEAARTTIATAEAELLAEVEAKMPAPAARSGAGVGPLRPEVFPPCIRAMRRVLQDGENLSHAGRFALAAFLHRAGANAETIVDAYRGAPDFDESVTRYQVEHITQRDSGRGYSPSECSTLRTHGLCFWDGDKAARVPADQRPDPLCHEPFLRHPLQYYRIRGGTVAIDDRERSDEPVTATGAGPGTPAPPERRPSTGQR